MPFIDLSHVEEREMAPGFRARFVHTDVLTLAFWRVRAGAVLPEHAHPHEQVTTLIEGAFSLTVDGRTRTLVPDNAAVIPPGIPHSGRAETDCTLIDVFHPPRDDYR
jgi:quercetin dioxygenase-like cupin family protein